MHYSVSYVGLELLGITVYETCADHHIEQNLASLLEEHKVSYRMKVPTVAHWSEVMFDFKGA